MGIHSKIEWLNGGHTASPWYGCAHVHAGCDNCYAETLSKRNPGTLGIWGADGTRVKSKSFISSLRKWNREAEAAGKIVSVFPSLCDPFEDRPELEPWRREMFEVIDQCPHVRLMLLTKRPGNVPAMWPLEKIPGTSGLWGQQHRRNVWLLASVSDQASMDTLFPELARCRGLVPVLGLSAEPLLGPIDMSTSLGIIRDRRGNWAIESPSQLNWVIVGGESGPGCRIMNVEWARSVVSQCKAANVACFVKQLGGFPTDIDDEDLRYMAKHPDVYRIQSVKDKKGGEPDEWPAGLNVRQFPEVSA